MKHLIVLTLLLTFTATGLAQEEAPQEPIEHRIVSVMHTRPKYVAELFSGRIRAVPSDALNVISLTGTRQELDAAEEEIRKLDVAALARQSELSKPRKGPNSMELYVHYLGVGVEGQQIPAESPLNAVVAQLRRNFAFEDYRLVVSYMVRAAVGDEAVRVEGVMPDLAEDPEGKMPPNRSSYQLQFNFRGFVDRQGIDVAILRDLSAEWNIVVPANNAYGYEATQVALSSAVDLPEGKLVVLGKAGVPGRDTGIFVVLEARPVE